MMGGETLCNFLFGSCTSKSLLLIEMGLDNRRRQEVRCEGNRRGGTIGCSDGGGCPVSLTCVGAE